MAVLPRVDQKIFGSNLTASGNVAVVGSTATGTPVYSTDLATLQGLTAYLNGFAAQTVKNSSPVLQEFNALMLIITQQLAYILERGVSGYSATTTYYMDAVTQSGGVLYQSLQDNNLNKDPATETDWWAPVIPAIPSPTPPTNPALLPNAYVTFSGATGTILSSYNVSGVSRTAAGSYTISFATPLATAAYGVVGTCGASNGGSRSSNGNNNGVCRDNITTVNQVSVWTPKPDQTFGEDADVVSVWIFGA